MNRVMFAILSILDKNQEPVNSAQITDNLVLQGIEISERTVRHYLKKLDEAGFTANGTRRGRKITQSGREELCRGFAMNRVGFIIDRINRLSLSADFNPDTARGRVVMNVSHVPAEKTAEALDMLEEVMSSPYALCDRIFVARGGERIGDAAVPEGMTAIGTVCSVTINALFLRSGIPVRPRVGGIIEVVNRKPTRFQSFISYEHSTVAPLETFIRSRMTRVLQALLTGEGCVLGSFREIPGEGLFASRSLCRKLQRWGFRSTFLHGCAFKPLLGIGVSEGMVGLVDIGGLNPAAALAEAGLSVGTSAMAAMQDFSDLKPVREVAGRLRSSALSPLPCSSHMGLEAGM